MLFTIAPNTSPYPHKTVILGITVLFSCSSSSPRPLPFFGVHQYFFHLPSNKGGVISPPIARGRPQLPLFNHLFFYTPVGLTFHMGIGGDILGNCCSNSPNIHKNNIGLPQYIYIGDRLLGNWWRCSKAP